MFSRTGRGAFWAYRRSLGGLLSSLLGTLHGPPLVAAILDALDGASGDERWHWVTATFLVRDLPRQPELLVRLLNLTTDPDKNVRVQATYALGDAADQPGVLARLLELTTDPDTDVQYWAAGALGNAAAEAGGPARLEKLVEEFGLDALVQNLQRIVRSDAPDDWPQARVVPALVVLYGRSPQVLDHLIEFLRHSGRNVRNAAGQGLVAIGQSSAALRKVVREALLDCLTDPRLGGMDKDEHRMAADSAYDALWALEVAAPTTYSPSDVL